MPKFEKIRSFFRNTKALLGSRTFTSPVDTLPAQSTSTIEKNPFTLLPNERISQIADELSAKDYLKLREVHRRFDEVITDNTGQHEVKRFIRAFEISQRSKYADLNRRSLFESLDSLPLSQQSVVYDAFAAQVQRIQDEKSLGKALNAQGVAFASLPEKERTGERYDAFTPQVQRIGTQGYDKTWARAGALHGQGIAFAALPESERTTERYDDFVTQAQGLRHGADGTILSRQSVMLAALPEDERTVRYEPFVAQIQGQEEDLFRGFTMERQGEVFASLPERERTVERYDAFMTQVQDQGIRNEEYGYAAALNGQGIAFASLPERERTVERYETLANQVQGIIGDEEAHALALKGQGIAFTSLPEHERTIERYKAFTAQVQRIEFCANALEGQAVAFAALPERERTRERYNAFAAQTQGIEDDKARVAALKWQRTVFATLPERERTGESYDAFSTQVQGIGNEYVRRAHTVEHYDRFAIEDDRTHADALKEQSMVFTALPEYERTGGRYDAFATQVQGVRHQYVRAIALKDLAIAFAALPESERTVERYDAFTTQTKGMRDTWDSAIALEGQGIAFAALPESERTVRHDVFTTQIQEVRDKVLGVNHYEQEHGNTILAKLPAQLRCALLNSPPPQPEHGKQRNDARSIVER